MKIRDSIFGRLLTYVLNYRHYLLLVICFALITVTANLLAPLMIGQAIDLMAGPGKVAFSALLAKIIQLALVYVLLGLSQWFVSYYLAQLANRTAKDLRNDLFTNLTEFPLSFFDRTSHGDVISRFVNDVDQITEGLLQALNQLVTGVITILGAIGFMLYINPLMAAVVLVSAPITYFVARFITLRTQKMFKLQAAMLGRLNGLAEEMIGGQRIVTAFNYQDRAFDQFNALNQELYGIGVKAQFYSSLPNPTTRFVNNITYIAVGIIGCFAAIMRVITVGDISSFLIYANVFAKPFNEISGVIAQFQSALASAGRVFELIDTPKQAPDPHDAVELAEAHGMVAFKHVNFAYQKNRPLIQDFNLAVKPGCRIAIVGATGAGKTTIVNLLMRFYDVDSGTIQVDGISTDKISRDSLRRSFGMVLQDTWLFSGTVRENIAYGRPGATDEEIEAAAKAASAHSFIRRLPEGYNTRISSTGDNFSQGEIQLLTIARVMLAQPPMLILDEATSNIDVITEMKIQKAFLAMMAGRTSFVIAHRLSTIKEADLILVMENGNIIESGSHAELLAQQGAYYRLYNSQFAPNQ